MVMYCSMSISLASVPHSLDTSSINSNHVVLLQNESPSLLMQAHIVPKHSGEPEDNVTDRFILYTFGPAHLKKVCILSLDIL